jgi:zinc transporter 9
VTPHDGPLPTKTIALSLIGGFAAMLLVEQLIPGGHSHISPEPPSKSAAAGGHARRFSVAASTASDNELDLDHEIELLESNSGSGTTRHSQDASSRARAVHLSTGLIIHCLADGFALGASAIPIKGQPDEAAALPLIVFLALVIHKGEFATLALSD